MSPRSILRIWDPHTGISWCRGRRRGLGRLVVRGGGGSYGGWGSSSCGGGLGFGGLGLLAGPQEALELGLQVGDRIGSCGRGQRVRFGVRREARCARGSGSGMSGEV